MHACTIIYITDTMASDWHLVIILIDQHEQNIYTITDRTDEYYWLHFARQTNPCCKQPQKIYYGLNEKSSYCFICCPSRAYLELGGGGIKVQRRTVFFPWAMVNIAKTMLWFLLVQRLTMDYI